MRSWFKRIVLGVSALAALTATVVAQGERGSIRGTVNDPTGAVVPEARIVATNKATGVETATISTEAGNYSISQLPPGSYKVAAEKTGFKKHVRENVKVDIAGVVGLDISLEVGESSETIAVTSEAPQLRTETTEVSTSIPPKAMADLPLTAQGARNPANFLFLAPGGTGDVFNSHINGAQTFSTEIEQDGLSLQSNPHIIIRQLIGMPPEAIQEASLATGTYSAEYSSGGGVARFVTRSGTNEFHGNLYEFLRNEAFDARGFFQRTRSRSRQNEYGGSLGGPIWIPKVYNGKNRSFFFFNIDYFKQTPSAAQSLLSLPSVAFKKGDLSGLTNPQGALIPIYDPATTREDGSGGFTRDPFPGNIIPEARISSVSRKILSYVPDPTLPGFFNNWLATGRPVNKRHNFTVKIDHRFNDKHSLSGVWNRFPISDVFEGNWPGPSSGTIIQPVTQDTLRFAHDWIFSPSVANHLSVGLNRQTQSYTIDSIHQKWGEKLGLKNIFDAQFPVVRMGDYNLSQAGGSGEGYTTFLHQGFVMKDGFSMVRGKQNVKFGFDLRKLQIDQFSEQGNGLYNFSRAETAFPSAALRGITGFPFASFLLGDVDNASLFDSDNIKTQARVTYFGAYVQDDVKLRPNLTLNLGLRWDVFTPFYDVGDFYSVMDPTVPNPAAGGRLGAMVFAGNGQGRTGTRRLPGADDIAYRNFGPHVGIAWSFKPRWVVRTGYALTYFPSAVHMMGGIRRSSLGFEANPSFISSNQGLTPAFNWDSGFPAYKRPPFIDPGFGVGSAVWEWHDGWMTPYRQEWSFNIQRQLGNSWLVDVGYVGAKGTRLSTGAFNENQVNPSFLSFGDLLLRPINDPAVTAAGFGPPYPGFSGTLAQSLRPFPQYTSVGTNAAVAGAIDGANIGNSTYHSAQIKVEKQFGSGLYLLSSFVWSKLLTDSDSAWGGFFSDSPRDFYNRKLNKTLSPSDVSARFVSAFTYEVPIGPGKALGRNTTGVAGKLLGGWQLNGILQYQGGAPISVVVNNTLPLFNAGNYPNIVPGVNPLADWGDNFDPAKNLYLNIAAFQQPAPFTYGNAPVRLSVRTFPSYNENIGFMKRTTITESVNLEIRFEMFNIFNRVRFGAPSANVSNPFNFGRIGGQANSPRQGQIAVKINF